MEPTPLLTTRRDFLRTTLLGGALSWTVPSFVANTFSALHASADGALTQIATGKDGPILVLVQLAGATTVSTPSFPTQRFLLQRTPHPRDQASRGPQAQRHARLQPGA